MDIPSLIGYHAEEAEEIAAALGLTVDRIEAPRANLLPPHTEPRVGRQRLREDGTLELLMVQVPVVETDDGET